MSQSENQSRSSYAKWIGVSAKLAVVPIISLLICIIIFYSNLKPGGVVGIWVREFSAILLLQILGVMLPCLLITWSISRVPPVPMSEKDDSMRVLWGGIAAGLFLLVAIALTYAVFSCGIPNSVKFKVGVGYYAAFCIQPFAWGAFGLALNNFRNVFEGKAKLVIGFASVAFAAAGFLSLLANVVSLLSEKPTLLGMMIPTIAGVFLILGFCVLVFALRAAKLEHSV